jgi:hypothetical protein
MNEWNFLKLQSSNWQNMKFKTKLTWNERHEKHNWNKEGFRVYLGCHLKKIVLLSDPHLDFCQMI